jgi:DNA-binding LacI/PurR family transcriptional regulator
MKGGCRVARGKRVSLKDVAERSGVSPTTASVVLNGRWEEFRIAPATRDEVLATAERLGYVPSRSAKRQQLPGATILWCIFAPTDFDSGPTAQFFNGVHQYAKRNPVQAETLIFPFERGRLREKEQWISANFASGAIMVGLDDADVAFLEKGRFDIPIVLYNRVAKRCSSVTIDDYGAGQRVMRHFLDHGLSRPAVISPEHSSRSLSLRAVGFADELKQRPGQHAATPVPQIHAENSYAGGYSAAQELISGPDRPTGIFVLNDQMVGGVMNCLQENGLAVPGDIQVVSYGDNAINTVVRPTVSSVAVPVQQLSFECARTLHQAIDNPEAMKDVTRVLSQSSPAA